MGAPAADGGAWLASSIAANAEVATRQRLYAEALEGSRARRRQLRDRLRALCALCAALAALLRLWLLDALGISGHERARVWRRSVRVQASADARARASRAGDTTCFVDGSAAGGSASAVGLWYGAGHALTLRARLEGRCDSTRAEVGALWLALVRHPRNVPLSVLSDSRNALRALEAATADGPLPRGAPAAAIALRLALQLRGAPTVARRVAAHSGQRDNEMADRLAAAAAADGLAEVVAAPDFAGGEGALGLLWRFRAAWAALVLSDVSPAAAEAAASGAVAPQRQRAPAKSLQRPAPLGPDEGVTETLAIDAEMVGVGPRGALSALARIAVVNSNGHVVYHSWAKPKFEVTDYRTWVSGVRAEDIADAPPEDEVAAHVRSLLTNRVVVGHSVECDLEALGVMDRGAALRVSLRDTAVYRPLCHGNGKPKKLRVLARHELGLLIQQPGEEHHPVDDARAAMYLYLKYRQQWDHAIQRSRKKSAGKSKRERRDFGAGLNLLKRR